MQKFEENTLRSLSKGVNNSYVKPSIDEFIADVQDMVEQVIFAIKRADISGYVKPFGAYNIRELSNQKEYINLAVILSSDLLYKETAEIGKIRFKNRRFKNAILEHFKRDMYILLEKYFARKVNIKFTANSIFVESIYLIGANFRIFVFTQSFNSVNLLAMSSYDILPYFFNIDVYEQNFIKKDENTNGNYYKVCNVIKSICLDEQISEDSFIIESLLYNLDDALYEGMLNEQIFKIFNEVMFIHESSFGCIDAKNDKNLFANKFIFPNGVYYLKSKYEKLIDVFTA